MPAQQPLRAAGNALGSEELLRAAIASGDATALEKTLKSSRDGVDPALLRDGVLKLASLNAQAKSPPSLNAAATPHQNSELRHWLHSIAGLDASIIDKTVSILEKEEVFSVADLKVLQTLPRFAEALTAVTRQKICNALPCDTLPVVLEPTKGPSSPGDSMPDWLAEAAMLCDPPVSTPTLEPPAPATLGGPKPRRRAQSFKRRGERASAAAHGFTAANGATLERGTTLDDTVAAGDPSVCRFYLRGACHFGSKCRLHHPEGEEGSAIECFICGERGHKRMDCPRRTPGVAASPAARDVDATINTAGGAASMAPGRPRAGHRRSASFSTARGRKTVPQQGAGVPAIEVTANVTQAVHVAALAAPATAPAAGTSGTVPVRSSSFRRRQQRKAAAERKEAAEHKEAADVS